MTTTDPTAIPIELDPAHQRMVGVAVHGNTPFDVPYVSQITGNLWQGGCANGLMLPANVEHVISLYPWEQYRPKRDLKSMLAVRLYDSLDAVDREQVIGIAEWVNVCRADGVTLVHCQAGLNRSSLVAGLALVLGGWTPEKVIAKLRAKRSPAVLCNPVFEQWLRDFRQGGEGD